MSGTEYQPMIVPMTVSTDNETVDMSVSMVTEMVRDYNRLINKPQINNVELVGNKTSEELGLADRIKYGTKEFWNDNREYIPAEGELIVVTDNAVVDGVNVPAIKVGDGLAYVVDLPFVNDDVRDSFLEHINNRQIHVNTGERSFWNNKVRCYYGNNETLVFTVN